MVYELRGYMLLLVQSDTAVVQSVTFVSSCVLLKMNLLLFQCMKYELYVYVLHLIQRLYYNLHTCNMFEHLTQALVHNSLIYREPQGNGEFDKLKMKIPLRSCG